MPRGDAFKYLCYWRVLSCADRSGASRRWWCLAAVLCWKASTLVAAGVPAGTCYVPLSPVSGWVVTPAARGGVHAETEAGFAQFLPLTAPESWVRGSPSLAYLQSCDSSHFPAQGKPVGSQNCILSSATLSEAPLVLRNDPVTPS